MDIRQKYHKIDLLKLFLVVSFPIHLWAIIVSLRSAEMIVKRTHAWDVFGLTSYLILFALLESAVIFILVFGLSFLLPAQWEKEPRSNALYSVYLAAASWGILGRSWFMSSPETAAKLRSFLGGSPWLGLSNLLILLLISVILPLIILPRNASANKWIGEILDRLQILSAFYLILDILAVGIIIFRNLFPIY